MRKGRLVRGSCRVRRLARSLAIVTCLYAVGTGAFLTGTAVYFTQVVGIRPALVGLAVSIADWSPSRSPYLPAAWPTGSARSRVWVTAAVLEGLAYLCYPWIKGFAALIAVLGVIAMLESAGLSARGAYTLVGVERGERVNTLAYVRSALNIGFTIGAGISGLALSTNDDEVIRLVPLVTSAIMLVRRRADRPPATRRRDARR